MNRQETSPERFARIERIERITRERIALRKEEARQAPRVIARYLTLAGQALGREELSVAVTEQGPREEGDRYASTDVKCAGCGAVEIEFWNEVTWSYSDQPIRHTVPDAAANAEHIARTWAERHAEKCRELPVEG